MIDPALVEALRIIKDPKTQLPDILTPDINIELDQYQKRAIHFADVGRRIILADEAGIGKTLTGLGLFSHLKLRRLAPTCIVVAPATAVLNTWHKEIANNTSFNPIVVIGETCRGKQARHRAYEQLSPMSPIIITNYEVFRTDYMHPAFLSTGLFIFDESSAFKTYSAVTAEAARYVSARCGRVLLLNATPVEKDVLDLYSQVNVLYPGYLGKMSSFIERYCTVMMQPIMRYDRAEGKQIEIKVPKITGGKNLEELAEKVECMILRRMPEDVGLKYPEVVPQELELPQSLELYKVYNELKYGTLRRYNTIRNVAFGVRFGYMLLACISPSLVTKKPYKPGESPKFDAILTMAKKLKEAKEPFVVFSRFRISLEALEKLLTEAGYTVGSITGRDKSKVSRMETQDRFNAGKLDCLLINMAGAKSLNLPVARFLIFLDCTFNPMTNKQVIFRLCRRTSLAKKVFVYILLIANTLERKVMKVLATRTSVARDVLDGKRPLTMEEMKAIFLEDVRESTQQPEGR